MNDDTEQELESLSYIYPDELSILSAGKLQITLPIDNNVDSEEIQLEVLVTLPLGYPNVIPIFSILHPLLHEDEMEMLVECTTVILENSIGIGMIYLLVESIIEKSTTILNDRIEREALEMDRLAIAQEEEERLEYLGTRVTKNSFIEWKRDFVHEAMVYKGKEVPLCFQAIRVIEAMGGRGQTGRDLFEGDEFLKSDLQYAEEGDDVNLKLLDITIVGDDEDEERNNILMNFQDDD